MGAQPTPIRGPRIKHDGLLTISVGASRKAIHWKHQELLWSTLLQRLAEPVITSETLAEYQASPKSQQDDIKDVGGFVGGPLAGGRRKLTAVKWRQLITLDIDHADPKSDVWSTLTLFYDYACAMYSTHSHSPLRPRLRLVIPLLRPVTAEEYPAVSRLVAADLGIDQFDPTTFEPHRLMYWPSSPRDVTPVFEWQDGPWLDPDAVLARYADWTDPTAWPEPTGAHTARQKLAERQGDPTTKPGIVGAFCRTYDIEAAIQTFLSDIYTEAGEGRYTYRPGSTTGGLVLYDDGRFAYSHHSTDPCSGRLVNAFDLVRIHLFGERDDEAKEGTPTTRLPSYLAMVDLARQDEQVRLTLGREAQERVAEEFGAPPAAAGSSSEGEGEDGDGDGDDAWLAKLERDKQGRVLSTRHNALLILEHDPRLAGSIALNELTGRPAVRGPLPWPSTGDWGDRDDEALRHYLERVYGVDSPTKVHDALGVLLTRRRYHPVREYLQGLTWDGVERLDRLFVTCLGAEDTEYVRVVTRKALVAAVARAERPGCKWDHVVVLVGAQGIGKSLLLKRLGGPWFSDSLTVMSGKEAYEQLQGVWIMELGELAAMRRAEVEAVKHFISKQEDIYRMAYGRHTRAFPRQVVFFGSTNTTEFLHDVSGNRRFWPIRCEMDAGRVRRELLDIDVDQVWAEAVVRYRAGEELYLGPELTQAAIEVQEQHREESEKAGAVREFLEKPIPADWAEWDLAKRREWWHGSEFGAGAGDTRELVARDRICVMEIWVELFMRDQASLTRVAANELHDILQTTPGWEKHNRGTGKLYFGPIYGHQRAYVRKNSVT